MAGCGNHFEAARRGIRGTALLLTGRLEYYRNWWWAPREVLVVRLGVVRSGRGDYVWYGSDVLVATYAD